jgi:hypothetical protein
MRFLTLFCSSRNRVVTLTGWVGCKSVNQF